MSFGLVILVAHAAIYALDAAGHAPLIAYWLPRSTMIVVLLGLLWSFRHQSLWPTNSVERLIWVVWIGYLVGVGAIGITLSASGLDAKFLSAFSAILSGLGFFVMGVHVWGGAYVIGLAFMCTAPLMGAFLRWASLTHGVLWCAALLAFGMHYWRLALLERR